MRILSQLLSPVLRKVCEKSSLKYSSTTQKAIQRNFSISRYPRVYTKELSPIQNVHPQILLDLQRPILIYSVPIKSYGTSKKEKKPIENKRELIIEEPKRLRPNKPIPKVILVQSPFSWIAIKFKFIILKLMWDMSFNEKDFLFGTRQAVSKITEIISEGQESDLNGLMTKTAKASLKRDLDRNWNERLRKYMDLERDDVKLASPRNVRFITVEGTRYCFVDMAFLALKWETINHIDALLLTEIYARFRRNYTPNVIPEWTVTFFKVTKFKLLKKD